eukprot:CAMPEP_0181296074 /NCGR_PEP_ID=MMETSP1101-20121128/4497_1 /TAXON_ID=46948 /ORGANISM="Rhodomonas abbreviata, Strain Caron Lab Isolate" /LENGTH=223 /DNA_ID=CAMNT_0023400889 /DNA_START=42 /DNA_END=713 /DNA_ORIENTATION=-
MTNGPLDWADEWIQGMSCDMCRQRQSTQPSYEKGDLFSTWLQNTRPETLPDKPSVLNPQKDSPAKPTGDVNGKKDAFEEPVVAVVLHAFTAQDPRPFPPDVHGDMTILPGQSLFVYPNRTTSGWCFAESTRNGTEKGWVPGNYISRDGQSPFVQLEDMGWKGTERAEGDTTDGTVGALSEAVGSRQTSGLGSREQSFEGSRRSSIVMPGQGARRQSRYMEALI